MLISKDFTAEAAHRVPNHNGKCANLHGHSYKITITVEGKVKDCGLPDSDAGMVMDFAHISYHWKTYLEPKLDHQYLNESIPEILIPTAEMIAVWIMATIISHNTALSDIVHSVTVRETANSSAQVGRSDPIVKEWSERIYGDPSR